ncbi:MAG TPA: TonB-dependent receptor, partial [Caulobacteraceae bacterium]
EELAQVEVTSVSRRPEALGAAAAAIYVISREDIRRSGAASLPEVLRIAPNLQVQRMTASEYAITARGFNGFETANKLLVLVDGRSVYSSLHSGVFWDMRSVPIETIERIEVVSGPGGALYGANAVNGVINIITRSSADTQGTQGAIGVGNEDRTFHFSHSGAVGAGTWRAYISGFDRDDSLRPTGGDATDAISGFRGGVRADLSLGKAAVTLQGDLWDTDTTEDDDYSGARIDLTGGNVLARLTRPLGQGVFEAQAYYDWNSRLGAAFDETVGAFDLHVQHSRSFGERHAVVWGAGYRVIDSELTVPPGSAGLTPAQRTVTLGNIFIQDQITLTPQLTLTVGAKFEDNSFTGQELLPNARLAWSRPDGSLLWGAVSRATRTPSRIDSDLTLPGVLVTTGYQSERLTAFEVGYRSVPLPNVSFSLSAFYNVYDDLRTVGPTPVTFFPIGFTNDGQGTTYGMEAWGSYDVNPRWRLSAGVSALHKDFEVAEGAIAVSGLASVGDDPDYQVLLRSQADLTDRLELDVRLRAVGELVATDAYVEADVRVGWRLTDRVELSITGQNLINDIHLETGDPNRRRAFGRAVYAALRFGF